MTEIIKQRIIEFVRENQPVTEEKMRTSLGLSVHQCRAYRKQMKATGQLFIANGSGCFISQSDFEDWLRNGGGHEKMKRIGRMGGRGQTPDREQRRLIIEYLTNQTEPFTAKEIYKACHINQKSAYRILASLLEDGTIGSDGKRVGRRYVLDADSAHCDFDDRDTPVKAFVKYNPKRNGVVQAYLNSPARQRIMMIYGRC